MKKVKIIGWNTGLKKISLVMLLKKQKGMSLNKAKAAVDEILNDNEFYFLIEDSQFSKISKELDILKVKFNIEDDF